MAIVVKYASPTRFNMEKKGTVWRVEGEENQVYIQVHENKELPEWVPLSSILLSVAMKCKKSDRFFLKILDMYEKQIPSDE